MYCLVWIALDLRIRVEYDCCVNSENELLVGVQRNCSKMRS